jgi:hypothetical protein
MPQNAQPRHNTYLEALESLRGDTKTHSEAAVPGEHWFCSRASVVQIAWHTITNVM